MNKTILSLVLISSLLGGCASLSDASLARTLGQDRVWKQEATDAQQLLVSQKLPAGQQREDSETASAEALLQLLEASHPQMTALVQLALDYNPSLQQTLISLKLVSADLVTSTADQRPSADLAIDGNRVEDSESSYNSSVTLSWQLDLWHKFADVSKAAQLNVLASEQDLVAAQATLIASVIKQSLALKAADQQLELEQQRSQVLASNQQIIVARYKSGLSSLEDLHASRTAYANAMANLTKLQEDWQQDKRSLLTLFGSHGDFSKVEQALSAMLATASISEVALSTASFSAETLTARPDVRAALLRIEREDALTSAAYKELLPSFSISAGLNSAGGASSVLMQDPLWALLANLTAPLYQGGQLKAAAERQQLQAQSAYWFYMETLLSAAQEVEDAQGQESSLQRQLSFQRQALSSAQTSEKNYQARYRQGLVDILDLLQTQQTRFDTESNLIQTQLNLLSNRIDLGLALGLGI